MPSEPQFDVVSSADQITATTSDPEPYHGQETNANPSPIATFPTATWYRVDANGLITMTPDPRFMPGQPTRTYSPAGNARFTWSYASINTSVVIGNQTSDSTANVYVEMSGSLASADRPGYPMVSWNAYCGVGYPDPCGRYTGPPTTFTFTRLDADLTLTADSTTVVPGSTVTFTYAASPSQVEGKTMPVVVDSVRWVPDSAGDGGETTEQGFHGNDSSCNASTMKCTRQIIGSGTFTLIAWVNGKAITRSVHIQTPPLVLAADPDSVHVGETSTFTPSWADVGQVSPGNVSGWAWSADSLPGATTACPGGTSPCNATIREAGTMNVSVTRGGVTRTAKKHVRIRTDEFKLRAAPSVVAYGGVITFRAFLNGQPTLVTRWSWVPDATAPWDTVAGCAAPANECHRATFESGTMWAYGANNKFDHVEVFVDSTCQGGLTSLSVRGKPRTIGPAASRPRFAPTARPQVTPQARGRNVRTPASSPARTIDCSDTLATRSDAGTDSLPLVVLHVTVDGGIKATPAAGDYLFPSGTVLPYAFVALQGYEPPVIVVDTLTPGMNAFGSIALSDTARVLQAANDSIFALRPGMDELRRRVRSLLDSADRASGRAALPATWAAFMKWVIDTSQSPTLETDLALAEYLEFDLVADSAKMGALDDALANYVFQITGDFVNGHTIRVLKPSDYAHRDTVVATGVSGRHVEPGSRPTRDMSPASDSVVFIFVNGIRTFGNEVGEDEKAIRTLLLAAETFPRTQVASYWNRNLRTELNGFSDAGCNWLAVRDAKFRKALVAAYRLTTCERLNNPITLTLGDLKAAVGEFIRTNWKSKLAPLAADADSLAQLFSYYHGHGWNTVGITHSQGNMVFAEALTLIPGYDFSALNRTRCTADLSLAAPINRADFGALASDGNRLRGIDINGDILMVLTLPNDFTPYEDDANSRAAGKAVAAARWPSTKWWTSVSWGQQIHKVMLNYFEGDVWNNQTQNQLQALHDFCINPNNFPF